MHRDSSVPAPKLQLVAPVKPARSAPLAPLKVLADTAELASLVGRELVGCRRFGTSLAVLVARVDGPTPAPALLQAIGERLRSRVRATDLVVQLGDGGFGVVLLGAARAHVVAVQQRLLKALTGPYGIEGQLLDVHLRIGVAGHPALDVNGTELVRAAEPSAA